MTNLVSLGQLIKPLMPVFMALGLFPCGDRALASELVGYWQDRDDPGAWIEYQDDQLIEWLDGRRMSASPITIEGSETGGSNAYRVRYSDDLSIVESVVLDQAGGQMERQAAGSTGRFRRLYSPGDPGSAAQIDLKQIQPWKTGGCATVMMGFDYRASSTLPSSTNSDYGPIRLLDGRSDTAWVEGAAGNGIGERLTLQLSAVRQQAITTDPDEGVGPVGVEALVLDGLQMANGYSKSQGLYMANGRVAQLRLELDEHALATWEIADTDAVQAVAFQPPLLLTRDSLLRLEITKVYAGTRYEDTAITELLPVIHACAQVLAID